jgi:shikimate dehydrogenase
MLNLTIFGNPVEHSKSPFMQNAGLKSLNIKGNYDKSFLEDGSTIKDVFLEKKLNGANITVPHKEDAYKMADEVRGLAKQIGAVNTYINENGKVIAYNTDAPGFMKAIEEFGDIKNAIILGAGGTAKAIAVAFKEAGINTTVINRSEGRLEFFKNLGCETHTWDSFKKLENYQLNFDLVVNSTSAGLKDEEYPIPFDELTRLMNFTKNAIDCIYGKITPFLKVAKYHGINYKDGEDMLLFQGVIALEYFTNQKVTKDVVEAMRKGLKGA